MKITMLWLSALLALVLTTNSYADKYDNALKVFQSAGESSHYFDEAYGYALFPTIGKGGIGIGGAHGKGKVFVGGKVVGTTTMNQLSVGFQLGGQTFSQIIFFEDERAFSDFSSGDFEFSAGASMVAITAGANAQASTTGSTAGASGGMKDASTVHAGYNKGLAVFTVAKGGLMYEASIAGQKFTYESVTE